MNLQIDFSDQMLIRVTIHEGGITLCSIYSKQLFDSGMLWDSDPMTTLETGRRLRIDDRDYEILHFRLHTYKIENPEVSMLGIDSDLIGPMHPTNMILQIHVRHVE